MERITAARPVVAAAIVALASLSACAFLTDFPDVEPLEGAGGSGTTNGSSASSTSGSTTEASAGGTNASAGGAPAGSSGTGGGQGGSTTTSTGSGSCDGGEGPECQSCFPSGAVCPVATAPQTVEAEPSDAAAATTSVRINDGFRNPAEDRDAGEVALAGHFYDSESGAAVLTLPGTVLLPGQRGGGFVIGGDGELLQAGSPCREGGPPDEVFFNALTYVQDGSVWFALGGAFEGGGLRFHEGPEPEPCATPGPSYIAGPDSTSDAFVPFLAWFSGSTGFQGGLAATDAVPGYIADVARFPRAEGPGDARLAAIGLSAAGAPFGEGAALAAEQLYVVIAGVYEDTAPVLGLGVSPCVVDHYATLEGLKTSIAVDGEGDLWAAGTGCPLGEPGPDGSFLIRVPTNRWELEPFGSGATALWGGTGDAQMSVRKIASDGYWVFVAGTYTGRPEVGGALVPEEGSPEGSGFVMAFDIYGWSPDVVPEWFVRIESPGSITVRDLEVEDGRLFVGGGVDDQVLFSADVAACFSSPPPGGGRAFVAELSAQYGEARWIRVEGFEDPEDPGGLPAARAFVDTLVPGPDGVLTATMQHGALLLECGEQPFNPETPLVAFRELTFP